MSIKLSAIALGITLAYGATAAMATEQATIWQGGWDNLAQIEQYGADLSVAKISQDGIRNDGFISQNSVTSSDAEIKQTGNLGTAVIDQSRHGKGSYQVAYINQIEGWHNVGGVTQSGSWVDAHIVQSGKNNRADIEQYGGGKGRDRATVSQNGRHNETDVIQSGNDLIATVTQAGWGHDATLTQSGQNLWADINQTGVNHEATITQSGSNKIATITQSGGYNNVASIMQSRR